jgi:hypothetical protein
MRTALPPGGVARDQVGDGVVDGARIEVADCREQRLDPTRQCPDFDNGRARLSNDKQTNGDVALQATASRAGDPPARPS